MRKFQNKFKAKRQWRSTKCPPPDWQYHEPDHPGADFDAPPGTEITAPADGLILMDLGYEGLGWQVDEYSRALAATVQSRMARASVARVMERAMTGDQGGTP